MPEDESFEVSFEPFDPVLELEACFVMRVVGMLILLTGICDVWAECAVGDILVNFPGYIASLDVA